MTPSIGAEDEGRFERTLTVSGPVTLDVEADAGSIRIQRGDAGSVTIRALLRARPSIFGWRALEDWTEIPVEQSGNTIRIDFAGTHVALEILVPAETSVQVAGDSADLQVEGLQGPVDCETDSGEIEIASIGSGVSATTDSGAIHIRQVAGLVEVETDSGEIDALEIGGAIDAETDSGNIQLSQTTAAPVNASTDSGSISIKLASSGGYTIRVCTDSGRIDTPQLAQVQASDGEVEGQIRGGGSVVDLETDSGDIEVILP